MYYNEEFTQKILLENATTFVERNQVQALTEADLGRLSQSLVGNMYQSLIEKAHVDFDDIPKSRGRIEKYSGIVSMLKTLDTMSSICEKTNADLPELNIVSQAIANISNSTRDFEAGFKLGNDFVIMSYNTLVMGCVQATTALLASFVDYIKNPDNSNKIVIIKDKERVGSLTFNNLERFNITYKKGEFQKCIKNSLMDSSKNFVGAIGAAGVIKGVALTITAMAVILPVLRELVYQYFNGKVKIKGMIEMQQAFLEANKLDLENRAGIDARKKEQIIEKQSREIDKLERLKDKFIVDNRLATVKSTKDLNEERKGWTLGNVQQAATSQELGGLQLF